MLLRRKRNNPARRRVEKTSLVTKKRLSKRSLEQTQKVSSIDSEELVENPKQTQEEIDKLFSGVQGLDPLRKIVEGKRVIYVGPSPILKGRGMGEFIDSFDVVFRSNNMYKVPEELWEDYGKRCDVAFFNNHFIRQQQQSFDVDYIQENDIEIFSKIPTRIKWKNVNTKRLKRRKKEKRISVLIYLDENGCFTKKLNQGSALTTGLILVKQILLSNPSVLHLTGVDFYLGETPHITSYASSNRIRDMFGKFHKIEIEISFFKNQILKHENLMVDNFLLELLHERGVEC